MARCGRRAVGNSTVHAASSRSHAMLELELVTPAVVLARRALLDAEGDVVPIGKALDDERIREASHSLRQTATGAWETFQPNAPFDATELRRLTAAKDAAEAVVDARRAQLAAATGRAPPSVGGVLLFADLAGAEFAASFGNNPVVMGLVQSAEEQRQSVAINQSLLALNECMRALHERRSHVPFRNSTLTRMLKRFLTAPNATSSVLATVSPAANHRVGTVMTLTQIGLLH
jgi:hypothetical protein